MRVLWKMTSEKEINPNNIHNKCFAFESKRFEEKTKVPKQNYHSTAHDDLLRLGNIRILAIIFCKVYWFPFEKCWWSIILPENNEVNKDKCNVGTRDKSLFKVK